MAATKYLKFQYYRPFITNEETGETRVFDFYLWIEKADAYDKQERAKKVFNTMARLDEMSYYQNDRLWGLRFMKMRDFNIPFIVKIDGDAEDMQLQDDEYVGEGLHILYRPDYQFLMVQMNRFSLSISALEVYLTTVWSNPQETISIRPIMKDIDLNTYTRGVYKKLNISFANMRTPDSRRRDARAIKGIFDSFYKFGCYNANLSFSLGYTRNTTLERDAIQETFRDINANRDIINSAEVVCCDGDGEKSEVINLLDCVVEDIIPFIIQTRSTLAFEYAMQNMIEKYKSKENSLLALIN